MCSRFSLPKNVQTGSGAQPFCYSKGEAVLSKWQIGRGVKLATHLNLVPKLKNEWNCNSTPPSLPPWCWQGHL